MDSRIIPKFYFLTSGAGIAENKLTSFEFALRDAGCERFNLVPVSSICPPDCEKIDKKAGISNLNTGEIVYCVMCRKSVSVKNQKVAASVVRIKHKSWDYGYFIEHCNENSLKPTMEEATQVAVNLMDTLDSKREYSEIPRIEEVFTVDEDLIKPRRETKELFVTRDIGDLNIDAVGHESENNTDKKWMTVLATAVFIP